MFFRYEADAEAMLEEKWVVFSAASRPHEGVELEDSLGLGTTISISPRVPRFQVVDPERSMNVSLAARAYVQDLTTDRYSIELLL